MTTPTNLPSVDDVLMGGGARAAKFEQPGDTVSGRIVGKPASYHVREFDRDNPGQGPLAYFPSGDPIIGIKVDVQTAHRDDADDDGVRRIYIEKARQLGALRDAVRAAGANGIEIGGTLSVTLTGSEPGKGTIPAFTYAATYRPPAVPVPGSTFPAAATAQQVQANATGHLPQQRAATVPAEPVQPAAPAAAAPVNVITETVAAAMANAGIDTSTFAVVPG